MNTLFSNLKLLVILAIISFSCQNNIKEKRKTISLNGKWQIAKTEIGAAMPSHFSSTCPVPGLVDMASPAINMQDTSYKDAVYWYKRTFTVDDAEKIQLKINKAKYHTKVFLNGRFVGENLYNFTPGYFDIKPHVKMGEENEIIISVGCENNASDTVMTGHDFEKMKYIPGIYDEIKIIASGYPFIEKVQTVPNIDNGTVRIVADVLTAEKSRPVELTYRIKEKNSGETVAEGKVVSEENQQKVTIDFSAEIKNVQLWSPESPFLYTLELETRADSYSTNFGMRSFTANPNGTAYLLNGKPYYMRGTNVCILRFFEDPDRAGLPWDEDWAVKVHQRFKEMGWNSIRYCIGFPPERWYHIADSLGFLIADEYPVWTLFDHEKIYPDITADYLADEYRTWLPEHWNHPCVVIWDAQNESITEVTGEAAKMVRNLDLSDRLWENGWMKPIGANDPIECHPYLFGKYQQENPSEKGPLSDLLNEVHFPFNSANNHDAPEDGERYSNPVIINEYAWLWLNRDGSTTTLTDRVYDVCFGENLETEERIEIYMKHLGILTEYWRAHRQCAGVLHFCGLGYSRPEEPRGQTSDHFIDIQNLTYEPKFLQYVKPAFAPVGIMINYWELSAKAGQEYPFEIYTINDLETTFKGILELELMQGKQKVAATSQEIIIEPYGRTITEIPIEIPKEKGKYQLVAQTRVNNETVRSIREFDVK
jgi:hypothetical protein